MAVRNEEDGKRRRGRAGCLVSCVRRSLLQKPALSMVEKNARRTPHRTFVSLLSVFAVFCICDTFSHAHACVWLKLELELKNTLTRFCAQFSRTLHPHAMSLLNTPQIFFLLFGRSIDLDTFSSDAADQTLARLRPGVDRLAIWPTPLLAQRMVLSLLLRDKRMEKMELSEMTDRCSVGPARESTSRQSEQRRDDVHQIRLHRVEARTKIIGIPAPTCKNCVKESRGMRVQRTSRVCA